MSFSMASLLSYSAHVPPEARAALLAARAASPEDRDELLESAALILHRATELPCADVRELVDLSRLDCA